MNDAPRPTAAPDAVQAAQADVFALLGSSANGLAESEAARRLAKYGPNEAQASLGASPVGTLIELFANPLVLMLLIAAAVSGVLGDHLGAGIIVAMVLLSVVLNYVLSYRSKRAAERLR